jgi:hypothetical protein
MGGKLFGLGRISRCRYLEIEAELKRYLDKKLGNYYRIPRYYDSKPDFGDLDAIVSSSACQEKDWQCLRQEIVDDLGIKLYKSDGHVFSTVYQNFQVDYFLASADFFESTYNYLSFNDLGNLLGKICRRFNLKYGDKGLVYVFRHSDGNYTKDLPLTTNFAKICAFLQLDYDKWQDGFTDLNDLFEWVINCPYFSVLPYLDPSRTLARRAKERTTIQTFIEYLETNKIDRTYNYLENRDAYLPWLQEIFPEARLDDRLAKEKEKERIIKLVKVKFNGKLIMELLPDLQGKILGEFIVKFKQQYNDFDRFILTSKQEEIDRDIRDFYTKTFVRTPK